MADTYVLVHGAWHTGELLEPVAQHIRAAGHAVHCPTLAGNRLGDDRATVGLSEAAQSLIDYLEREDLKEDAMDASLPTGRQLEGRDETAV